MIKTRVILRADVARPLLLRGVKRFHVPLSNFSFQTPAAQVLHDQSPCVHSLQPKPRLCWATCLERGQKEGGHRRGRSIGEVEGFLCDFSDTDSCWKILSKFILENMAFRGVSANLTRGTLHKQRCTFLCWYFYVLH